MSVYVGLDVGSRSAKGLILRDDNRMEWVIADTEPEVELTARKVFERVLDKAGASRGETAGTVATGYGRVVVSFASSVTEITCHARGAVWLDPEVRLVLDMGG
ncbi:MAG: BadF/BadG/BcrA/BcrD ATPase family protein, partial [Chloroflexota bacterium]